MKLKLYPRPPSLIIISGWQFWGSWSIEPWGKIKWSGRLGVGPVQEMNLSAMDSHSFSIWDDGKLVAEGEAWLDIMYYAHDGYGRGEGVLTPLTS